MAEIRVFSVPGIGVGVNCAVSCGTGKLAVETLLQMKRGKS
jgi:hypothetical protein